MKLLLLFCLSIYLCNPATSRADGSTNIKYEKSGIGTKLLKSRNSETLIKILVEQANLGSDDLEIGEITLPAGLVSKSHAHGAIEIFYILSGEMEHIVNEESHLLKPGMVGIVRPGDTVIHKVPESGPCRALIIWTPGGEIDRLSRAFDTLSLGDMQ